ncbi:MAG TPA: glyoxylate/hydroxypyruvate reductase A [Xanthobacteraceae bacterium]|nr:glyoxylate/hydroxypyruvate reductase A [Xanthobacteraceae bacterium]
MAGAILIAVTGPSAADWIARFRREAGRRDIRCWPDVGTPADIAYACGWHPPPGAFAALPNLKAIFNLGAGVDAMLADPTLPAVPLVRAVHPDLTNRMVEYVLLHVLMHHRRQRLYDAQQRARLWRGHPQPAAAAVAVGVMGLGAIGAAAAAALRAVGFRVAGWSRTPRRLPDIECFHGPDGLDAFLARTEILVCLLPATPETEGILNRALFRKLKRDGALGGAYLVNAGRGRSQSDADILAALKEGTLAGATLDVFATEPLPPDSPLWSHPGVTVTPHNAGDLDPDVLVAQVLAQIERHEQGLPLVHLVDRTRGY